MGDRSSNVIMQRSDAFLRWPCGIGYGSDTRRGNEEETMPMRGCALVCALLCPLLILVPRPAAAQGYRTSQLSSWCPLQPGAGGCIGAHPGEKLNQRWGQPVIIKNRGGAGGNVGVAAVARAAPDGHTLLLNASSHVINASLAVNRAWLCRGIPHELTLSPTSPPPPNIADANRHELIAANALKAS
jgi:hypothetical protein